MVHVPDSPVTFAGGFSRRLQSDRALAVEEERNQIQRERVEQAAAQAEQQRRTAQLSEINSSTKAAFDLFTQEPRLAKEPTTVALFEQSLETQGQALQLNGVSPEMLKAFSDRSAFQRQIVTQLASEDPAQVRDAMEKLEAIQAATEATGSEGEGRVAAGLPAGTAQPMLFVHKSGSGQQIGVDPLDMEAQKNLIDSGFVPVPGGVAIQAGSLSEIDTPLTPAQVGRQAELATQGALNITQLSSILGKLDALGPGVTGVRGIVGSAAGGVVGQLNETLGAIMTEQITGVDEAQLQSFRVESRAALARSITQFSGEESGRFTEQERALTNQALALLAPDASFPQIKAAAEIAMKLSFLARDRNIFNQGLPFQFDLDTDEGVLGQASQLFSFGLSEDATAETISDQIKMRSLLQTDKQEADELEKARTR